MKERGVVFVIIDQGKILLERRVEDDDQYQGYIVVPGGRLKKGESWEEALCRELSEECGIKPENYKAISELSIPRSSGAKLPGLLYLVTSYSGKIINKEPEKSKHVWATFAR